jgi:hypothetical protein
MTCRHCGAENFVAKCSRDARPFVLTTAHLEGRLRELDDGPVRLLPPGFEPSLCDFCTSKDAELVPAATVMAGMRQATCAVCHTEFLSDG